MKTRIISALVGLIVLGVAIAFYDTIIFNLFITALAVIGIYEGHHAASLTKKTLACYALQYVVCCSYSAYSAWQKLHHASRICIGRTGICIYFGTP